MHRIPNEIVFYFFWITWLGFTIFGFIQGFIYGKGIAKGRSEK
jgi:hypothetical protein